MAEKNLTKKNVTKKFNKENITGMAFVAPAIILMIVFLVIPFILTVYYSFTDYNILKPDQKTFIGLQNFVKLSQDKVFIQSVFNTFKFMILVVPLQVCMALGLALLVNKKIVNKIRLLFFNIFNFIH